MAIGWDLVHQKAIVRIYFYPVTVNLVLNPNQVVCQEWFDSCLKFLFNSVVMCSIFELCVSAVVFSPCLTCGGLAVPQFSLLLSLLLASDLQSMLDSHLQSILLPRVMFHAAKILLKVLFNDSSIAWHWCLLGQAVQTPYLLGSQGVLDFLYEYLQMAVTLDICHYLGSPWTLRCLCLCSWSWSCMIPTPHSSHAFLHDKVSVPFQFLPVDWLVLFCPTPQPPTPMLQLCCNSDRTSLCHS